MKELKRISPLEATRAVTKHRRELEKAGHKPTPKDSRMAVAQAQLESIQKVIGTPDTSPAQELIDEIEEYFKFLKDQRPPIIIGDLWEIRTWWQDLKERCGGK